MNRKVNRIGSSRKKKSNNKINSLPLSFLFFYLAAASGAVDEGIFEDAFNASHPLPVRPIIHEIITMTRFRFSSSSFLQAKM